MVVRNKSIRASQTLLGIDTSDGGNRIINNYFTEDVKMEIASQHGDFDKQIEVIINYLEESGNSSLVRLFKDNYESEIRNFIEQIESFYPNLVTDAFRERLGFVNKKKEKELKAKLKSMSKKREKKIKTIPKRNIKVKKSKKQKAYKRSKPRIFSKREEIFISSRIKQNVKVNDIIIQYNKKFDNRTESSLKTKYYRLKK